MDGCSICVFFGFNGPAETRRCSPHQAAVGGGGGSRCVCRGFNYRLRALIGTKAPAHSGWGGGGAGEGGDCGEPATNSSGAVLLEGSFLREL